MANKAVKPSEDYMEFLPEEVQQSTKIKTISEKNVLATLCFYRLNYSNYATTHDGWFYCSHADIMEGCGLKEAQLKRVLTKLVLQKLIQRKSGTNHRCTHYKLHKGIDERLPKIEGDYANEPLAIDDSKSNNEPLARKTTVETPNEPLDKNRLVKTSQEKTSLNVLSNKSIDDVGKTLGGDFTKSSPVDIEKVIDDELKDIQTFMELRTVVTELRKVIPYKFKDVIDKKVAEKVEFIRALVKT